MIETAALRSLLENETRYKYNDVHLVLTKCRRFFRFDVVNTKHKYFDVPCAFDIESTSFSERAEKRACMYVWTFCIYGCVIVGRTWDEFTKMIDLLSTELKLNEDKRLIVYVHNLSFDFQFLRKWFNITKVFSTDRLKPLYALCDNGIEFRCSWQLSGYKLDTLGKELKIFKLHKMTGDLDYDLIRTPETPLSESEWKYCTNDVRVVVAYIAELIIEYKGIAKLPLTKTGFVRNYCRNKCFYEEGERHRGSKKRTEYCSFIRRLSIAPDEYEQLRSAFRGGFTHANPFVSGDHVETDVTSFDIASSYPTVMIANRYPMSSAEMLNINGECDRKFIESINHYCCVFDCEFYNLRPRIRYENYLSESSCIIPDVYTDLAGNKVRNVVQENNGRLVKCGFLRTTLTDVDYNLMKVFYDWDEMTIGCFRRYERGYLPTDLVKCILDLYKQKTEYKGVKGKEEVYARSKTMINAIFGMMVTNVARDEYPYIDNEWQDKIEPDIIKVIDKYNKSGNRFTSYAWGVFITAYARQNLFAMILNCENIDGSCDYIYADTDSVKMSHAERHIEFVKEYNSVITRQLERAIKYHGLPVSMIRPKTAKGKEKPLGVYEFDGHYSRFKTLGAKRYMVEYSNDARNAESDRGRVSITVSGVDKEKAIPYLMKTRDPFKAFSVGLYLPPAYTGKLTHTYIDKEIEGDLIDYMGNKGHYHELSYIHLEPADYTFSISQSYADYLLGIEDDYLV